MGWGSRSVALPRGTAAARCLQRARAEISLPAALDVNSGLGFRQARAMDDGLQPRRVVAERVNIDIVAFEGSFDGELERCGAKDRDRDAASGGQGLAKLRESLAGRRLPIDFRLQAFIDPFMIDKADGATT